MSGNHLHEKAVEIVGRYKRAEAELIDILQRIDHAKAFRELGCASLFVYAVEKLGLSEGTAYNFINVARKAVTVPALKQAIVNSEITVATRDRATYVTDTRMQLTMGISEELMAQFKRVQDLESQRQQSAVDYESTLKALLSLYLDQRDPIRKNHPRLAKLAKSIPAVMPATATTLETPEVGTTPATPATPANPAQRVSRPVAPRTLTPSRKHFILKAHASQCSHRDDNGKRCAETRWLHVHHRKPREEGGTHTIENLTVLCAAHHRMQHFGQTHFDR